MKPAVGVGVGGGWLYAYLRDLKVWQSGFAALVYTYIRYGGGWRVFASFDFHIQLPQTPLLGDSDSPHGNDVCWDDLNDVHEDDDGDSDESADDNNGLNIDNDNDLRI